MTVLGSFMTGYYTMQWNNGTVGAPALADMGLVDGVRRLRRRRKGTPIMADKYGDSKIDGVYRGGDCFLAVTFKEWTSQIRSALWPFGADFGAMGQVGRLEAGLSRQIVLTAEAGSLAAAANGPATITADLALIAEENDIEIILGNEQRDIPVLFQLLPYADASSVVRWFSIT